MPECEITDEYIKIQEKEIELSLIKKRVIESEKKIFNLAKSLFAIIPGLSKTITGSFLNADETKWLSQGVLNRTEKLRMKVG